MNNATPNDPFLDRLRNDARVLRYEADDVMLTRLAARVRERILAPVTVTQLLARWFRPVTATVAALAATISIGLSWYQQTHEPVSVEQIASIDRSTTVEGEFFSVGE
jgi:hypothetical protein